MGGKRYYLNTMNRREVLKLAALLPVAGLQGRDSASREVLLLETVVAGFQYYEGPRVWNRMQEGDQLELKREEDNPYDHRAVEVYWKGRKLGYIPRVDNSAVSQLLDRGNTLVAVIDKLKNSPNPWERVRLKIYIVL